MIQFIMMLFLALTNNNVNTHYNNPASNITTLSITEDPETESGDGNGHGNGGNTGGNTGQLPPPSITP